MFSWLSKAKTKNGPKTLGQIGEELAQLEYEKRGFKVVAANFFNPKGLRLGEIDFIAKDKERIVFVEVKTRTRLAGKFGTGAEAVNESKQHKLLKAVKIFLLKNQEYQALKPQIDVCVIEVDEFDKHLKSVIILLNAVEDWN